MSDSLQSIPNVGPAIEAKLERLGIAEPEDLRGADGRALYERLCDQDARRHDPCVSDVFAAAVYYVETGEALHWSEFSARRKGETE